MIPTKVVTQMKIVQKFIIIVHLQKFLIVKLTGVVVVIEQYQHPSINLSPIPSITS